MSPLARIRRRRAVLRLEIATTRVQMAGAGIGSLGTLATLAALAWRWWHGR